MASSTPAPLQVQTAALPPGGRAIQGMGEHVGAGGTRGAAELSVPFPVTPYRGFELTVQLS